MEAKSIITRPSGGQRLNTPGFRVDVSVDDGRNWQEAQLQETGADAGTDPIQISLAFALHASERNSNALLPFCYPTR